MTPLNKRTNEKTNKTDSEEGIFLPWLLVEAWMLPLPDTIQEQLDEAIGYGFDGMIVYADQAGKPPQYYAAGWHNRESRMPAKLDERFAFGVFDNEALYQRLRAKKQDEIDQIRGQLQDSELKMSNLDSYIENSVEISQNIHNYWQLGTLDEKRRLQIMVSLGSIYELLLLIQPLSSLVDYTIEISNLILLKDLVEVVDNLSIFVMLK